MSKIYFSIPVTLSEKNFKDFIIFDTMKKQRRWKKPLALAIGLYLSATLCFSFQESVEFAGILGSILVVFTVLIPTNYFHSFHSSINKQAQKMNLTSPRLVYTIELKNDPDGVLFFYPGESTPAGRYSWKSLDGAWHTKDAIYLYVTPEQALLMPNNPVQNNEAIWSYIKKNLDNTKIHKA